MVAGNSWEERTGAWWDAVALPIKFRCGQIEPPEKTIVNRKMLENVINVRR